MLLYKKRIESNKGTINLPYTNEINELLISRGISSYDEAEKFLNPSLSNMHPPQLFRDMDKLINIVKTSISKNKKIVVYGDYDCDGVCSVVIILKTLKK